MASNRIPYLIKFDNSINDISLSPLESLYPQSNYKYIYEPNEHYRLLIYLSNLVSNSILIDAGCHCGCSTLALAQNPTNKVLGYDTRFCHTPARGVTNCTFRQDDVLTLESHILRSASIILLDIDPHDGIAERKFMYMLKRAKFRGLVVLDDIFAPGMKEFWGDIGLHKLDITEYGHYSGTGVVSFNTTGTRLIKV